MGTHGHWVIAKTTNRFSSMSIDQAHEQQNRIIKGSGGVIGLIDNQTALRRWMLAGPELARMVEEFESEYVGDVEEDISDDASYHHEETFSAQQYLFKHVRSMVHVIKEMGNPFHDQFEDLVNISSRSCAEKAVVNDLFKLADTGKKQYSEYVKNVLENKSSPISDAIKKNKLVLFSKQKKTSHSKVRANIKTAQMNTALFGHLFVAAQQRESDLDTFFSHEINDNPPSLSDCGKLHFCKKSDLVSCLPNKSCASEPAFYDC